MRSGAVGFRAPSRRLSGRAWQREPGGCLEPSPSSRPSQTVGSQTISQSHDLPPACGRAALRRSCAVPAASSLSGAIEPPYSLEMPSKFERKRLRKAWPRVRILGLRVTAIATAVAGLVAAATSAAALQGQAPSLAAPFAMAAVGLLLASGLMFAQVRPDLVELTLGGLAGGSFGVTLAEMSAQAGTIADHYKSLWVPAALAVLLLSFLAFRSGDGA